MLNRNSSKVADLVWPTDVEGSLFTSLFWGAFHIVVEPEATGLGESVNRDVGATGSGGACLRHTLRKGAGLGRGVFVRWEPVFAYTLRLPEPTIDEIKSLLLNKL